MFGFSWYQSSKMKDQMEQNKQAQIEQIENNIIAAEQQKIDQKPSAEEETVPVIVQELPELPYSDAQLNAAYNDPKINDAFFPQLLKTAKNPLISR